MAILVTGVAGFIGMHTAKKLLQNNLEVFGIDNINDYYDVNLKKDRIKELQKYQSFTFLEGDIADRNYMMNIFQHNSIQIVIHLAAQAGVRYSITKPDAYIHSNLVGFATILEMCRYWKVNHLIYASSSSVYGANTKIPFSTNDGTNHPVSLYAATKKSNELMAHAYSHLYGIPTTGLRFFTVYGPWGRPDMAYFMFTKNIMEGKAISVFNKGLMKRDFTYIDDIVEGIYHLLNHMPQKNEDWDSLMPHPSSSHAPYKVYNLGNNKPVELIRFIETIEQLIGKKAVIDLQPMQAGDVVETYADIDDLQATIDFQPKVTIEQGLKTFIDWYQSYYGINVQS
ncbi:NAD-dependent epimerase [Bacillus massiliigorillae]|uniref:NAD-dependent epimerase n=1 Tax=Bacillus massiliigorillae TaxID=1243664 RepID=UPI0003A66BD7|nr:NAD-dependent epimerase [Bacillus massiliigorillae]